MKKEYNEGIVEPTRPSLHFMLNLGKWSEYYLKQEQIPNEVYKTSWPYKSYNKKSKITSKGATDFCDRSHPDLLKRLFEQEVPRNIWWYCWKIKSNRSCSRHRAKLLWIVERRKHWSSRVLDVVLKATCSSDCKELKGKIWILWMSAIWTFIANALNPRPTSCDVTF